MKLTDNINQMDSPDICRISPATQNNISSSQQLMDPSKKTEHEFGHKSSLNRYKRIEITPCVLSDHHGLKLDVNTTETPKIIHTHWNGTTPYWMISVSGKKYENKLKTF